MVKRVQFSSDGTKLMGAGERKHGREGGVSRGYFFQRRVTLLINGKEEKFNRGSLIDFLNTQHGQILDKGWSGLRSIKWSPSGDKDKAIRQAFETVFPPAKQSEGNEQQISAPRPSVESAEGIEKAFLKRFSSVLHPHTKLDFYKEYLTYLCTIDVAPDTNNIIIATLLFDCQYSEDFEFFKLGALAFFENSTVRDIFLKRIEPSKEKDELLLVIGLKLLGKGYIRDVHAMLKDQFSSNEGDPYKELKTAYSAESNRETVWEPSLQKDVLFTEFQSLQNGLIERLDFYQKYLTSLLVSDTFTQDDEVMCEEIYRQLSDKKAKEGLAEEKILELVKLLVEVSLGKAEFSDVKIRTLLNFLNNIAPSEKKDTVMLNLGLKLLAREGLREDIRSMLADKFSSTIGASYRALFAAFKVEPCKQAIQQLKTRKFAEIEKEELKKIIKKIGSGDPSGKQQEELEAILKKIQTDFFEEISRLNDAQVLEKFQEMLPLLIGHRWMDTRDYMNRHRDDPYFIDAFIDRILERPFIVASLKNLQETIYAFVIKSKINYQQAVSCIEKSQFQEAAIFLKDNESRPQKELFYKFCIKYQEDKYEGKEVTNELEQLFAEMYAAYKKDLEKTSTEISKKEQIDGLVFKYSLLKSGVFNKDLLDQMKKSSERDNILHQCIRQLIRDNKIDLARECLDKNLFLFSQNTGTSQSKSDYNAALKRWEQAVLQQTPLLNVVQNIVGEYMNIDDL
jgi:hypothetical protein